MKLDAAGLDFSVFKLGAYGSDSADRNELLPAAVARYRALTGEEIDPARIVVVGDTPTDVECAVSNGAGYLAVATGAFDLSVLQEAKGTTWAVHDLADTKRVMCLLGLAGDAGEGAATAACEAQAGAARGSTASAEDLAAQTAEMQLSTSQTSANGQQQAPRQQAFHQQASGVRAAGFSLVVVNLLFEWSKEARPAKERQGAVVKKLFNAVEMIRSDSFGRKKTFLVECTGGGVGTLRAKLAALEPFCAALTQMTSKATTGGAKTAGSSSTCPRTPRTSSTRARAGRETACSSPWEGSWTGKSSAVAPSAGRARPRSGRCSCLSERTMKPLFVSPLATLALSCVPWATPG